MLTDLVNAIILNECTLYKGLSYQMTLSLHFKDFIFNFQEINILTPNGDSGRNHMVGLVNVLIKLREESRKVHV